MELTSTSLTEGQPIELRYAAPDAEGENVSPQLAWSGAPEGTRSFAVTCYDPDAPTGSGFWHWIAFNIPADVTSLDEGASADMETPQWTNDYGYARYGGPCPPPGPAHRYIFTVYALDAETLDVPEGATNAQARFNIHAHILDQGSLTGTFALAE